MNPGDLVVSPAGPGVLIMVGGKPSGQPHQDFPGWEQRQLVVVEVLGKKYLFCFKEIEPVIEGPTADYIDEQR